MAFANAFLGIAHSLAHKVGGEFHATHGLACAILLPHVIRYNGKVPTKLSVWPKYNHYVADKRYQEIAQLLGLKADSPEVGVEALATAVTNLLREIGVDPNFSAYGIKEEEWLTKIDEIATLAYEDQCSPANPRMPLVADMKQILIDSFKGN